MKSWDDGYKILKKATEKAEKYQTEAEELLKDKPLTKSNYKKIKNLLEKDASILNKAHDKVEKIHRKNTKNFEQQWSEEQ